MRSNPREGSVWCEDPVRESWNRPRSPVQLKYGVIPALGEMERAEDVFPMLIRVVPPKQFGPL